MDESVELLNELQELKLKVARISEQISRELVTEKFTDAQIKALVFRVDDAHFALSLNYIEDVLHVLEVSPIPESPDWVYGLMNLRGTMIPVLDVLGRMIGSARDPLLTDLIVTVKYRGELYGIIVQQVFSVEDIETSSIQTVSSDVPQAPYVIGVTEIDGQTVYMLSLSCLLAISDITTEREES